MKYWQLPIDTLESDRSPQNPALPPPFPPVLPLPLPSSTPVLFHLCNPYLYMT